VQVRSDAGDERSREEQRGIGMSERQRARRRRDIGVSESEGMTENVRTSHRKTREGRVVSDKMDKTVVVAVEDRVKHSLYGKVIRRTNKLKAHDATNTVTIGDRVLIMETRPLSATKRWRVVEVLEKAK
jgi:small subunit ribosomal protein S17